jgi:hypothetical protein
METKPKTFLEKALACSGNEDFEFLLDGAEIVEDPNWVPTPADMMPDPKPEEMTCFECGANKTCEWAWDHYNTNGDCLAEK